MEQYVHDAKLTTNIKQNKVRRLSEKSFMEREKSKTPNVSIPRILEQANSTLITGNKLKQVYSAGDISYSFCNLQSTTAIFIGCVHKSQGKRVEHYTLLTLQFANKPRKREAQASPFSC